MTLLKCKNGHKWNYNGQNRKGEKATCPRCRVLVNIPSLIIAVMLLFGGIGVIYAEDINLPVDEPYDDMYCTFYALSDHVNFTCTWKWFLPDYVMDELVPLDIPTKTSEIPQHNLDLADKIRLLLEKGIPEKETPEISPIEDNLPEEPLTWEERQIEASIKKLDECLRGRGAWAAYQSQTSIEGFVDESRQKFAIRDNLSQNQALKKILMAIEECDAMRYYEQKGYIGDYELNKVLADLAGVDYLGRTAEHPLATDFTDQSDSMVATDPITDRDRADEVAEMERMVQDLIAQRIYKDPYFELPDEDLQPAGKLCDTAGQPAPVGQYATRVCPMDDYNELILSNADTITYEYILGLQCTYYFQMYEHKVGTDDFPVWLNHCLPEVTEDEDGTN